MTDPTVQPMRRRLPPSRPSVTHKATICNHDAYVIVGFHDDNTPAEVFIKIAKNGTEVNGLLDGIALTISLALQYGVPWSALSTKYRHTRFGQADDRCSSLLDGVAQMIDHCVSVGIGTPGAPSCNTADACCAPSSLSSKPVTPPETQS